MATLRVTFKALLDGDSGLTALLTGGISDAADHDQDGDGAAEAPRAADGVTLLPHAKIRWRTGTTFGPRQLDAQEQRVEVYVYQDRGFDVIEAALKRMRALLHDTYIAADDTALNHILHTGSSGELPAPEYGDSPVRIARFTIRHV